MATIADILQGIFPETYHAKNRKEKVVYPYSTFDLSSEYIERNQEGFYLDIDIFDYQSSFLGVFETEELFKKGLHFRRELTPNLNLIFSYQGSNNIATNDDNLKHRNLRFYVKTDWRNL